MPVPRTSRLVALAVGASTALTTLGVAAPAAATPRIPAAAFAVARTPAAPRAASAAVAPAAAVVRKGTRLTITVEAGDVQLVTGVLSRTTSQRIGGRWVAV